jgi:hypothetical protein
LKTFYSNLIAPVVAALRNMTAFKKSLYEDLAFNIMNLHIDRNI